MAPEIVRHNGEEEYTEKVDCFSFGMFLYEMVALRPPFEGSDCVKDHILDGGRPMLSHRVSNSSAVGASIRSSLTLSSFSFSEWSCPKIFLH